MSAFTMNVMRNPGVQEKNINLMSHEWRALMGGYQPPGAPPLIHKNFIPGRPPPTLPLPYVPLPATRVHPPKSRSPLPASRANNVPGLRHHRLPWQKMPENMFTVKKQIPPNGFFKQSPQDILMCKTAKVTNGVHDMNAYNPSTPLPITHASNTRVSSLQTAPSDSGRDVKGTPPVWSIKAIALPNTNTAMKVSSWSYPYKDNDKAIWENRMRESAKLLNLYKQGFAACNKITSSSVPPKSDSNEYGDVGKTSESSRMELDKTYLNINPHNNDVVNYEPLSKDSSHSHILLSHVAHTQSRDRPRDVTRHANEHKSNRNIQISPERNIQISSERNIQISPERNIQISSERNIQISPKRNIQISSDRNIEISPGRSFQISTERNIQISSERNTQISSQRNTQVSAERNRRTSFSVDDIIERKSIDCNGDFDNASSRGSSKHVNYHLNGWDSKSTSSMSSLSERAESVRNGHTNSAFSPCGSPKSKTLEVHRTTQATSPHTLIKAAYNTSADSPKENKLTLGSSSMGGNKSLNDQINVEDVGGIGHTNKFTLPFKTQPKRSLAIYLGVDPEIDTVQYEPLNKPVSKVNTHARHVFASQFSKARDFSRKDDSRVQSKKKSVYSCGYDVHSINLMLQNAKKRCKCQDDL